MQARVEKKPDLTFISIRTASEVPGEQSLVVGVPNTLPVSWCGLGYVRKVLTQNQKRENQGKSGKITQTGSDQLIYRGPYLISNTIIVQSNNPHGSAK